MQDNRRNIFKTLGAFQVLFRVLPNNATARVIIQYRSAYFNKQKDPEYPFGQKMLYEVYGVVMFHHKELFLSTLCSTDYCWFDLGRDPQAYEFYHNIDQHFLIAKLRAS